jgi:hypothetical protein
MSKIVFFIIFFIFSIEMFARGFCWYIFSLYYCGV